MTGFVYLPVWLVVVWYFVSGTITLALYDSHNCIRDKRKSVTIISCISVFFLWPIYAVFAILSSFSGFIVLAIFILRDYQKEKGEKNERIN